MPLTFAAAETPAIPLVLTGPEDLSAVLAGLTPVQSAFATAQSYLAGNGDCLCLPAPDGSIAVVLVGLGKANARARGRFHGVQAASKLPAGTYRIDRAPDGFGLSAFALGWLLEGYRFDRYRKAEAPKAHLIAPAGVDAHRTETIATAECQTRDLINTPASDMGPAEIEAAVRSVAQTHGGQVTVIAGDDLLAQNFPMIHAVGRAAGPGRAPRLIDMIWGTTGPRLTLVGKGVCFDTGGLDIKPASSMGLMKKDMGGAATALGLAQMIMALRLPIRLRLLIPAVENSIAGNAFRPQDILTSRKGLTVEINNTDAEGRLVLADALALGAEDAPDLMVSLATLTGAARTAVGPDIAPFFTDHQGDADALTAAATRVADPVWRLPFHDPYEAMIEPGIADLDNAPSGGMAGAITAALFLRRFASPRYLHFDIYGWQPTAAPGRPKGGAGQGARALLDALPQMLGL
jgi:leucyl aminopeptidase